MFFTFRYFPDRAAELGDAKTYEPGFFANIWAHDRL